MILTPDTLVWLRAKRVILLDGAFDPLHAGHLKYFREATKLFPSHLMLVSVCSDEDIRKKGREPLLDQLTRCMVVQAAMGGGYAIAKDGPTEDLIERLKPAAYVKGADWTDALPDAQIAACVANGVEMVFLKTVSDSSSDRLKAWVGRENARHLANLETLVQTQTPASEPWQPVTDYSFEARKEIEGKHPELIKEVFGAGSILDVGCGPGHLVRLLKEGGTEHVCGVDLREDDDTADWYTQGDVSDPEFSWAWSTSERHELVIARELLEHLTIRQLRRAVANLCAASSKFVYVTTRYAKDPAHLLSVDTKDDLDPTHQTMLCQDFLRTLFVLEGAKRRADLEARMDWQNKGRVLVYEV